METSRQSNKILRYAILALVLGFLIWTWYREKRPLIIEGSLEYRMVSGTKDGQFQVILLDVPDRWYILDSTFREVLDPDDEEIVSRPTQLRFLENYDHLEYLLTINESRSVKSLYRVSREQFNQAVFGTPLRYEVNKKQRDSLLRWVN